MSVEAVVARVEQLQQLVGAAAAPGGNGGQDFASQLTAASAGAATPAPAQPGATLGFAAGPPSMAGSPLAPSAAAGLASASSSYGPSAATGLASSSYGPSGAAGSAPGPAAGASALPPGVPYGAEITAAARRHGIDPALLAGLVRQESNFDPAAGSPAGARGLTQLMPRTAASLGVTDVTDPAQALEGGAKYLRQQLDAFGGDVTKALAAYNAGPGAVQRFDGVPPYAETRGYVQQVQAFAAAYRGAPTGSAPAASPSLPYSIV